MELARSTSRGGLSLRRIFTFALAVLFTATLWAITAGPATYAADASWSGSSIVYNENTYIATTDEQTLKDVGLESASKVHVFVDPKLNNGNPNGGGANAPPSSDRKIRLIYFEANIDPTIATEAKYKDFTYVGQGNYTNPSAVQTLSFEQTGAESSTSCAVEGGLGWVICSVSMTLANAMDFIYGVLMGFIVVQPIETGQDNALYRSWKYMQAFANVVFVGVFLIIIYSQLTNAGISSYGLKKLLPRLIIAALLVNLSYFICSIAVDISNVLGYSLQDIFMTMRNGLNGTGGDGSQILVDESAGTPDWDSLVGFTLAGGTLAAAGGISAFLVVSDFGPMVIYLILPALLIALLAVLVALLVLAARQAIIIVLIILSPLAFVAFLLPNTEKWFTKWRDTFFTMLFIFPAFSVVFGGSQLAAAAIINTADSINLVILGMLVQVAPLFITPLLVKLGGSLIGRIAGLVNNPNKGIIDRTRKFAEDRTQNAKARRLAIENPARRQFLVRNAQWRERNRRGREGWRAANTARTDAYWAETDQFQEIDQYSRESVVMKSNGETASEVRFERTRVTSDRIRGLDTRSRQLQDQLSHAKTDAELQWERNDDAGVLHDRIAAKNIAIQLEEAKKIFESQLEELSAGTINHRFRNVHGRQHFSDTAKASLINTKVYASRLSNAQAEQQQQYAEALKANDGALAEVAGGISQHGRAKALAAAESIIDHALEEAIKNIQTTSSVPAGDVTGMRAKLDQAVAEGDLASTVAYINKLGESQNIGIDTLRDALHTHVGNGLNGDMLKGVKQFINANSTVNVGAEDIGSWSRDPGGRTLGEVAADTKTWSDMTPVAFASMKKSSQLEAMAAMSNAGQMHKFKEMADEIMQNPGARGSLKGSIREALEDVRANGGANPTYRPPILDDANAATADED